MSAKHASWAMILGLAIAAPLLSACSSTATRESTGEYLDDTVITGKVKSALLADKSVSGLAVKVETFKGVVQLSGFVDTEAEKRQAADVAARISGVTSVRNNIIVKTEGTPE